MKQPAAINRLKAVTIKMQIVVRKIRPYRLFIFLAFVGLIYAFLLLQIRSLNNIQPSSDTVTSQVRAARLPHIDQNVVQQLKSLQDNSVSVQALFNQARSNPFQ